MELVDILLLGLLATISSYKEIPKWRCTCCGFEKECLGKSTAYIIGIYEGRRRFVAAHKHKKPRCEGPFEYVEGVKTVKSQSRRTR